jgi:hypothetical protein
MDLEALKYPVGKWSKPTDYQSGEIKKWIEEIRHFPAAFCDLLEALPESSFSFRYRPEGWTLRQLAHHVVDSHMNAYIRHKLAYTESEPTITPYKENLWADLADVQTVPVRNSLQLLRDLHLRWTFFLNSIEADAYTRGFYHPEHKRVISLQESIGMYAWHCRHHLAHAQLAIQNPH